MKLLFTLLVMLLNVVASQAQSLKLGDYVVIDDVPSFVFYIDDSGKHGLVMTLNQALSPKQVEKLKKKAKKIKEKNEDVDLDSILPSLSSLWERYEAGTLSCNASTKQGFFVLNTLIPDELVEKLGNDGKVNQEAIVSYCKNHNIALEELFPYQSWASQLGKGWFIPGDKELELFAKFFYGGVGKEFKQDAARNRGKQVSDDERVQRGLLSITFKGLISSSSNSGKNGFRKLVRYNKAFIQWFEFVDKHSLPFAVCAVHEF